MKKNRKSQKNSKKLIVVLLICLLIFSAGFLWQLLNNKSENKITSFDDCVAAGKPIMESYPEQCSANGKTFVNNSQSAKDLPLITSQGLNGTIKIRSGDCMPMVDAKKTTCKTEIYTNPTEVIIKKDKEVVKNISGVQGTFEVELSPGKYSMYVVYKGEEYCNSFGAQSDQDCEFIVTANNTTTYTLLINEATD